MSSLIPPKEQMAIAIPHFPDNYMAVIWRNWGVVKTEKIAKILEATEEQIKDAAALMGLERDVEADEIWLKRGYVTIIRNAWHLLEYDQICTLLGWSEEKLAVVLKEDDFLWSKLGGFKPTVIRTKYRPLTDEEKKAAKNIAAVMDQHKVADVQDNAFKFLDKFYEEPDDKVITVPDKNGDLKFIYSYFALYGDPLLEPEIDPFPDVLLKKYAENGINGVWLQGVLYQLTPYPFDMSLSENWEKRIESLNALVKRAEKYGIGIYLYLNEPRNMPLSFFEMHPELKGHARGDSNAAMCTSSKEVQDYLYNAVYQLFDSVPGLGGFFTITRSENQTNCYSHSVDRADDDLACNCPRCKNRSLEEVVAEVNNIMSRAAKAANPNARAIAWDWGWDRVADDKPAKIINLLDKDIIVQATSERKLAYEIAGVRGEVNDYTMSLPGPGPVAKQAWETCVKTGHQSSAKVQFNTTWEMPAVPYLPVFDLVAQHIINLKKEGVRHFQCSWTLGGYPSPLLGMASELLKKDAPTLDDVKEYIFKTYGKQEAQTVYDAQKVFCDAFREYPFHISVAYTAPQSSGPKSPFFVEPTGYRASMVCFPYDNVKDWRATYPVDVFESQFGILCEKWAKALEILYAYKDGRTELFDDLLTAAEGVMVHVRTNYNLTKFVKNRDIYLETPNDEVRALMTEAILDEEKNVIDSISLFSRDSRIGFEASNQYSHTMQDLKEKLLNIDWCKKYYGIK